VVASNASSARPASVRAESSPGVLKQVNTSAEVRPVAVALEKSAVATTRSQSPRLAEPAGGNPARLTFSSPTSVRGDLTTAKPLKVAGVAPVAGEPAKEQAAAGPPAPKATTPLAAAKAAPTPAPANSNEKPEKHEVEEVAAKTATPEQKLRTSSHEPLRSQAAKATRQALEGKEEPDAHEERPAYAIAPIQSLQREEKPDEKPAKKEEKESVRGVLSGGMGGQAPLAPSQSFHQDERYGGSSPNFAPPRRDGGNERKPPETGQRPQGEEVPAARVREALQGSQISAGQLAQQQNLSQKQQDQEKRGERHSEEARDAEGVEARKETSGGSSKSGRGTESEHARRQQAQAQRQQQNSNRTQQGGRPRYVTRPQDPDEPDDISTAEDNGLNCCGKCGYILGGSADLACPVCTSEQPDLALRIFTQYRQQGAHWITCADTLAVTEDARHSLAEMATTAVHLHFVPKIPKYSQVLKLNQK